jgi:hypothetical protein
MRQKRASVDGPGTGNVTAILTITSLFSATAKEMSGFFCAVKPQPQTFNVILCASPILGRPILHGQDSSGSCVSNQYEIPLECDSAPHGSRRRGQRKPLIVATNDSNASTLNERIICSRHLKCICHKWWRKRPTPGTVQHLLREFGCGHYRIRRIP